MSDESEIEAGTLAVHANEDKTVSIIIEDVEAQFGARAAVNFAAQIIDAATTADEPEAVEAFQKLLADTAPADGEDDVIDLCPTCGKAIVGDCVVCNAPCCDSDKCESHCEHVSV